MPSRKEDYTKFSKPPLDEESLAPNMGYVKAKRLNIRKEPNIEAGIVCIVESGSELMIEKEGSTKEWFKVCTASGFEGYCMKKFVTVEK